MRRLLPVDMVHFQYRNFDLGLISSGLCISRLGCARECCYQRTDGREFSVGQLHLIDGKHSDGVVVLVFWRAYGAYAITR
jgi:hypothetical protein